MYKTAYILKALKFEWDKHFSKIYYCCKAL